MGCGLGAVDWPDYLPQEIGEVVQVPSQSLLRRQQLMLDHPIYVNIQAN